MSEPARTPLDPADLITDEDVATAMVAVSAMSQEPSAGNYYRGALEAAAPGLRARWVAEALETEAGRLSLRCNTTPRSAPSGAKGECAEIVRLMQQVAAEYRDGAR